MMKELILIYFLLLSVMLTAQPTGFNYTYSNDTFSTRPYYYTIFNGVEISDTAYYIIGTGLDSNSHFLASNFPFYTTGLFMKIDTNGQVIHNRLFKSDSTEITIRYKSFIKTDDDHFLLMGRDGNDAILYKIDNQGDTIWTKRYQTDSLHFFRPNNIITSKDGGYYLLLRTLDNSNNTTDVMRGTIIKINNIGAEQWRNEYIPTGFNQSFDGQLIENRNNMVLMSAQANGNPLTMFSFKIQTQIRKIDSTGNIITEYLSDDNRWIGLWDGIPTKDGGYVFCGGEGTQLTIGGGPHMIYRGYVAKVDSNLQLVWEKGFGQPDNTMYLKDIEELEDGSLILAGHRSNFFPAGSSYTVADSAYSNGWILKMSANGDSLWQRLHRYETNKWYTYHTLDDIEILPDGRFMAVGHIEEPLSSDPNYRSHGWLIRTDSLGCIVPGCQLLDNTENIKVLFDNAVTVFPNPASDVVNFRFDKVINEKAVIRVYSGLGQLIGETAIDYSDMAQINVSDWQSGMYFYGVYVENQLVKQGQILVSE